MLVFSNSKINLGLWILNKRADGYHNISTIFYPIQWSDVIEIIPDYSVQNYIDIKIYGLSLDIPVDKNIIYKAYQLLIKKFQLLPGLTVYLYKNVPFGAGLGAGSANATYFIKLCNTILNLNLSNEEIKALVANLGSDCVFFVDNKPALASEKGDVLKPLSLNLDKYYILVIYPSIPISTAEAYQYVVPFEREESLEAIINLPLSEWKFYLFNDFEKPIFSRYPILEKIKLSLYENKAIYASMSGSGSAIYGIFERRPDITRYTTYRYFLNPVSS